MTGATPPGQVVWITDSTPLISLAKVGLLHLVTTLADRVLVPQTVVDEVMVGRQDDPARQALASGWGGRVSSPAVPFPLAAMALDAGEESVLAAALTLPGSTAVLDDGKARNAARSLGVPVIGTLGIVARAKAQGHLSAVKPVVQALLAVQSRADDALILAVLHAVGERGREGRLGVCTGPVSGTNGRSRVVSPLAKQTILSEVQHHETV